MYTRGGAGGAQVHTLLKGLEKIAASADIPMLVAGDFNSVPGSAAHSLLVKQAVDPGHPVRVNPPQGSGGLPCVGCAADLPAVGGKAGQRAAWRTAAAGQGEPMSACI